MTIQAKYFLYGNGQRICYQHFGADDGCPYFYFHGFPGSRMEAGLLDMSARQLNIHIIAVDRPGYGGSTEVPGRTLGQWPAVVAGLGDHLGLTRFGVIGISGGGPYALACAHMLGERLSNALVVCGLAPLAATGLLDPMSWYARHVFTHAQQLHWPRISLYAAFISLAVKMWPRGIVKLLALLNGAADRKVLGQTKVADILATNLRTAFIQGSKGLQGDLAIYTQPWGFSLSDISIPIHLWHGDADKIVPVVHSHYLKEHQNGASLTVLKGEGHFSLPIACAQLILQKLIEDENSALYSRL